MIKTKQSIKNKLRDRYVGWKQVKAEENEIKRWLMISTIINALLVIVITWFVFVVRVKLAL